MFSLRGTYHPESAERMDEVAKELASGLIEMRKKRPEKPLRIGMWRKENGKGEILFAWDNRYILDYAGNISPDIAVIPVTPKLESLVNYRRPKKDPLYWAQVAGAISFRSMDGSPVDEALAAERRADILKMFITKEDAEIPDNYDFWILTRESTGRPFVLSNKKFNPDRDY